MIETSLPHTTMLEIPRNANAHLIEEKVPCSGGQYPCVICGRPCDTSNSQMVRMHKGGFTAVTEEESAELDADPNWGEGSNMGCYPVGNGCIKKHPELKPYLA